MSTTPPKQILRPGSKLAALKSVPEPSYFMCDRSWHRFYGVLSLLNIKRPECDNNKRLNYDIKIEYGQSPENLFKKVQRVEIETTGVHLLRFCELEGQNTGEEQLAGQRHIRSSVPMPAEVPSYLAVILPNPIIRFKSKHCFHDNDGSLEVYGESIGSVVNVLDCKTLATEWSNGADLAFVLNELHYLYSIGSFCTQNMDLETTLMATIDVLNRHLYDEMSPGHDNASRKKVRSFVSWLCDQKRQNPRIVPEIERNTLRLAAQVSENLNDIFRKPNARKPPVLYITDKGDIGLGTSATTKGDQVCAIYGVPNFMILRPDSGLRCRVVGPTCVSSQKLAEAILGRWPDGHDNTWVVYDPKKKLNVLKRDGDTVIDTRLSGFSDTPDFQPWEFDIDTNRSSLAKKLRDNRRSFLLT
ncbi:unnamed protein product [Clonostachys solani]|uniref:Uncharacterized protein n=1 Tax=Clonostachys solani TaxID=160281 RepID=A0A9N9ZMI0_9HYPO|nr:unnamed protein product [Clonostachys solani]